MSSKANYNNIVEGDGKGEEGATRGKYERERYMQRDVGVLGWGYNCVGVVHLEVHRL